MLRYIPYYSQFILSTFWLPALCCNQTWVTPARDNPRINPRCGCRMATSLTWLGGQGDERRRGASSRPICGDPTALGCQAQLPGPRALRSAGNYEPHFRVSTIGIHDRSYPDSQAVVLPTFVDRTLAPGTPSPLPGQNKDYRFIRNTKIIAAALRPERPSQIGR
jgi:hypothetical protein